MGAKGLADTRSQIKEVTGEYQSPEMGTSEAVEATENTPHMEDSFNETVGAESWTGRLVALRTKAEADASLATIKVYIAEIPLTSANKVLQCVHQVGHR